MASINLPEQEFQGFETPLIRLVDAVLARNTQELHSNAQEKGEKSPLTGDFVPSMVAPHQQILERR